MKSHRLFSQLSSFLLLIGIVTIFALMPIFSRGDSIYPLQPYSEIRPAASKVATGFPTIVSALTLPNLSQPITTMWHLQDAFGESSLFLLMSGSPLPHFRNGTDAQLQDTFSIMLTSSAQLAVVSVDKTFLQHLKIRQKGRIIPLLWDQQNVVRRDFALRKRYGLTATDSALLVIDRAGWLRRVEKVESAAQIESLLKAIGDPTPKLEVGQPAPDFAMQDMNGVLRFPVQLKGKQHLLLTFFPKCFTGTCAKQLESLRDAQKELQSEDVEVWAVSVDPADGEKGQRAFAKQLNLWFPLLPDTGRNLSLLYGAVQSPNQTSSRMSVLIDKQGIVRWIDKQINPTTHGQDVVAKVRSLSAQ